MNRKWSGKKRSWHNLKYHSGIFFYGRRKSMKWLIQNNWSPDRYSKYELGTMGIGRRSAENCALLGYYAACSGNFLPKFRDKLSVPSSGFKNPIRCPETLVRNYRDSLRSNPEERSSQLLCVGSLKSSKKFLAHGIHRTSTYHLMTVRHPKEINVYGFSFELA